MIFKSESWAVQVIAVDEYFLCRSDWKSEESSERCQCICMRILLAKYMVNVEVFELLKLLRHEDGCIVI